MVWRNNWLLRANLYRRMRVDYGVFQMKTSDVIRQGLTTRLKHVSLEMKEHRENTLHV